jgi:hypothetical protein
VSLSNFFVFFIFIPSIGIPGQAKLTTTAYRWVPLRKQRKQELPKQASS